MEKLITGEMIHNAYASVERTAQPWVNLSQEQVVNYGIMAEYLNDALELKRNLAQFNAYQDEFTDALKLAQATQETGYVWSPGEDEHEQP